MRRAWGAPMQRWGPKPKERWGLGLRSRRTSWGEAKADSSKLAEAQQREMRLPAGTDSPWTSVGWGQTRPM